MLGRRVVMDDLLREFLTETSESLDTVDNQLVRFEQEPNNAKILDNIFRLVHTIKGTCGFLGLPRLEALAHAAETLMGKFRDGMPVTGGAGPLILWPSDRHKQIFPHLARKQAGRAVGTLVPQVLERSLRGGEVSLDELERAFRETAGPPPVAKPEQQH